MFLIDSSVWIEYFRPRGSLKIKERIRELLELGVVVICGVVKVEIMRGAKNKRDLGKLFDSFYSLPQVPIDDEVIKRASEWAFELDRRGKVVPTTDLIIASAAYKKAKILHIDKDFKTIAEFFDIEEEMLLQ